MMLTIVTIVTTAVADGQQRALDDRRDAAGVLGDAADRVADAVAAVVAQREPLQVGEQRAGDVVGQALAEPDAGPLGARGSAPSRARRARSSRPVAHHSSASRVGIAGQRVEDVAGVPSSGLPPSTLSTRTFIGQGASATTSDVRRP